MSKKIPLTRGQFAVVDDKDYEKLSRYNWQAMWAECTQSYYAKRDALKSEGVGKKAILMHCQILGLMHGDRRQAHHKNHDTLDNRRRNLEVVSHRENNSMKKHHSESGVGIHKRAERSAKPFRARVQIRGKRYQVGYFETSEAARRAREEFLRSNQIDV